MNMEILACNFTERSADIIVHEIGHARSDHPGHDPFELHNTVDTAMSYNFEQRSDIYGSIYH